MEGCSCFTDAGSIVRSCMIAPNADEIWKLSTSSSASPWTVMGMSLDASVLKTLLMLRPSLT
ncbi:hypothetical protein DPMN_036749 [Dreissena polymorpha]|uniref:Uncharacterized protein n=1 Tax=Dreissena polymorpha TaxID=45954 RepID=A0A9D4RP44_DREPO|nr:hypothetical protein DPMN_036749 [Dreissena polymorpha]